MTRNLGAAPARLWRTHLHRSGRDQGRRARRHPGSPHHGRQAAAVRQPRLRGQSFGSNAAAWWGFHYKDCSPNRSRARSSRSTKSTPAGKELGQGGLQFRWVPQTDPFGVVHKIIDYPGVPVDHSIVQENHGVLKNVRVPIRPHFGVMGWRRRKRTSSIPFRPGYFGGNMDNWRVGKGATMYYPVAVPGGLFSVGDLHAAQAIPNCAAPLSKCR